MLLLFVSLTISRTAYAVLAAQSPWNVPISCVRSRSPLPSNANTLFARVAALSTNSTVLIVVVFDALMERSSSSCCCCTIKVNLSKLSSILLAGNGSLGTKSKPCVSGCSRKIVSCSPLAGAVTIVTLPPPASPTPLTV